MRTVAYLIAEILTLWAILLGLGALFIYFGPLAEDLKDLMMLCWFFVALFGAAKLTTIGDFKRGIWTGYYRPIRLLAFFGPAFMQPERDDFIFDYASDTDMRSYDIVEQLASRLTQQGIAHDYAGGVRVEDQGALWWVEPEFGMNRITGWVESEHGAHRRQIIEGLRAFLVHDLKLRIV
jgi:hypothetical protein